MQQLSEADAIFLTPCTATIMFDCDNLTMHAWRKCFPFTTRSILGLGFAKCVLAVRFPQRQIYGLQTDPPLVLIMTTRNPRDFKLIPGHPCAKVTRSERMANPARWISLHSSHRLRHHSHKMDGTCVLGCHVISHFHLE